MEAVLLESIPQDFYRSAAPLFIIALASLISALFPKARGQNLVPFYIFSVLALFAALAALLIPVSSEVFWKGAYLADNLAKLAQALILSVALVITIFFKESCLAQHFFRRESVSLFLLTILGMLVMVSSTDLVTLFVGLELSSIGMYILVGYVFPNRASLEGAMKYFVLGSFASAFLLFGFGLLYASSGTMNIVELTHKVSFENDFWIKVGILFTLVGLAFKLALVPFHMWAPDAYESAPTGITALMATSIKVMVLTVVLRLTSGLNIYFDQWYPTLFIASFLSMISANLLALVQTSIKRMLAYSSIAHSGYMAIVLCLLNFDGGLPYQAILFYLIAYIFTSLLAFGTLMWLEDVSRQNLQLDDLRGLMRSHPWASLALAIAMFSFAGMPPTVGFFAKFFIFNVALREKLYFLVFAGIFGSVISLYYYLRVIVTMYMQKPEENAKNPLRPRKSLMTTFLLAGACLAILLLGTVFPEPLLTELKPVADKLLQR